MRYIRSLIHLVGVFLARPGIRRTLQHASAAFVSVFASTLVATVLELKGSIDTKTIVALVVGAAAAGAVALFRALFPPSVAEAVTLTPGDVHVHVDTTALVKGVVKEVAKALAPPPPVT